MAAYKFRAAPRQPRKRDEYNGLLTDGLRPSAAGRDLIKLRPLFARCGPSDQQLELVGALQ